MGILQRFMLKDSLTIFCYHDVSNNPNEFSRNFNLNVPPDLFDFQIRFIKKNFNIISPDDLLTQSLPPKAALITFDDGFQSYFRNAIPILEANHVPSLIFLNSEPIQGGVFWSGLVTYLTEKNEDFRKYLLKQPGNDNASLPLFLLCSRQTVDAFLKEADIDVKEKISEFVGDFADEGDLEAIAENGLVTFGNHLYNHYVPNQMSDEEFLTQYEKNRSFLRVYPNYRDLFSFPFGQPESCFSDKHIDLLKDTGVKRVFYSSGKVNYRSSLYSLDRIALTSAQNTYSKIWFKIILAHFLRGIINKFRRGRCARSSRQIFRNFYIQ